MSDVVDSVIALMQREPENWRFNEYTVCHTNGLSVWIANLPILDTSIYEPTKFSPTLFQRFKLWKAIRQLRSDKIKKMCNDAQGR